MNPTSFEQYRADPAIRAAIDDEVRRLHAEACGRYLWKPLAAALKAPFLRHLQHVMPRPAAAR